MISPAPLDVDAIAALLAPSALDAARLLGERIADGAAEPLGRMGDRGARSGVAGGPAAPRPGRPVPDRSAGRGAPNGPAPVPGHPANGGTPGGIAPELAHRLLGAVENALPDTGFAAPVAEAIGAEARVGAAAGGMLAVAQTGRHDAFGVALALGAGRLPRASELVTALTRALVGAASGDDPGPGSAADLAAAHGRRWFGVAVVAATIVVRAGERGPTPGGESALVVGLALEATTRLLTDTSMPAGWAAARAAEQRAAFLLPHMAWCAARAQDGRIALLAPDATLPSAPAAEWVTAVAGGLVVRTGDGDVPLSVVVEAVAEPDAHTAATEGAPDWDEIVEVGFAGTGHVRLHGRPMTVHPDHHDHGFPWPGPVRARVHAAGRGSGGEERYLIRLWEAPLAPPTVLRDRPVAPTLPAVPGTPLIRTDFTDDARWAALRTRLTTPNASGFVADLGIVEDPRFADATVADLLALTASDRGPRCLFVVDEATLASPEGPVLVVGLRADDRGHVFRVVADAVWGVENNLALANLDFADFAAAADPDGVHRGF